MLFQWTSARRILKIVPVTIPSWRSVRIIPITSATVLPAVIRVVIAVICDIDTSRSSLNTKKTIK